MAYDLFKNRDVLDFGAVWEIAVGFAVAFITAVFVVRWVLSYISRHGYALFGWWRIIVGSVALVALSLGFLGGSEVNKLTYYVPEHGQIFCLFRRKTRN